jgi:arginine decarboxylase
MITTLTETPRVDAFFTVAEARSDRWRTLVNTVNTWQASAADHLPDREADRESVATCLSELRQWEDFFAYPGAALLRKIDDSIAYGDAAGAARAIHQVSMALSSRSYRENVNDWESGEESQGMLREVVKGLGQDGAPHKPYFEVLIVSPSGPSARAQAIQELRKLRRPQDRFVYEPVVVGSFEDAVLGTILNGSIQAAVLYDSIPFASVHNSPILRQFLIEHLGQRHPQEGCSRLWLGPRPCAEGYPA